MAYSCLSCLYSLIKASVYPLASRVASRFGSKLPFFAIFTFLRLGFVGILATALPAFASGFYGFLVGEFMGYAFFVGGFTAFASGFYGFFVGEFMGYAFFVGGFPPLLAISRCRSSSHPGEATVAVFPRTFLIVSHFSSPYFITISNH